MSVDCSFMESLFYSSGTCRSNLLLFYHVACHVIMSFSSFLNFLCHLRNNRITNLNSKCIFWTTTKVSYIILPLPPQCTCFNQLIAVHVLLKVAMLDYRRTNIAEALRVAASGTKVRRRFILSEEQHIWSQFQRKQHMRKQHSRQYHTLNSFC